MTQEQKLISEHFKELGRKGGKASWKSRRKKLLMKLKGRKEKIN